MKRKTLLAAAMIAGVSALTGCAAMTPPAAAPTPVLQGQVTAQPKSDTATPLPGESPDAGAQESGAAVLTIGGETIKSGAMLEEGGIFLPLEETGKALGWDVHYEEIEEETLVRKSVQMEKDDSRITVAWVVSDNTARQITWQKDGLLIPVDTQLTTVDGVVYVPAAFFETAMRVTVEQQAKGVVVNTPKPQETAPNDAQDAGKIDVK